MKTHSKRIANSFNRAATTYTDSAYLQHHVCRTLTHYCKEELALSPHILDLGSGTGILHDKLQSLGIRASITGLDIAEDMCKQNQLTNHQATTVADAHQLPFKPNTFPCIVSSLMMQWSPNLLSLCQEAYQTLKKDGVMAGAIVIQGTLKELSHSYEHLSKQPAVIAFRTPEFVLEALHQAGFSQIDHYVSNISLTYPSVSGLLKSIKSIGANTSKTPYEFKGKQFFQNLESHYARHYPSNEGIYSSWNILYFKGIK